MINICISKTRDWVEQYESPTVWPCALFHLGGTKVSLPDFLRNAMNPSENKRPPAFTMIGASDKALIARGGSGGIAIWSRLPNDIRPAAYSQQWVLL